LKAMPTEVPQLRIHGSTLLAVPAVHNRAVFASHVHAACSSRANRPDAIAVELGPGAVAAVTSWFTELGVGMRRTHLPVMLGLAQRNRRLHPRYRNKVIQLQKHYGAPLHAIPAAVLHDELGYSAVSLLCLSPTDSIIEAIRCGVELGIPVYGVDVEESAAAQRKDVLIGNPCLARRDLVRFVEQSKGPACHGSDTYIDGRREQVMASRLKAVLSQHERVLFTGGLGHWIELEKHLQNPVLPASLALPQSAADEFCRVLVHPAIAICHMDIFPSITTCYEKKRRPVTEKDGGVELPDFMQVYREQLDAACKRYLSQEQTGREACEKMWDWQNLPDFEIFIKNLCAVSQQYTPAFSSLLTAAEGMMSRQFHDAVAESLLQYDIEWARPEQFPQIAVLNPAPVSGEDSSFTVGQERIGIASCEGVDEQGERSYRYSESFYLGSSSDSIGNWLLLPTSWEPPEAMESSSLSDNNTWLNWVWPPCEYLLHGTAFEAAEISRANSAENSVETFEGSLLDGFDVKATISARIRGEQTIYVKRRKLQEDLVIAQGHGLEPTVFIFADPLSSHNGCWDMGAAGGFELREHIPERSLPLFDSIIQEKGPLFIGSVHLSAPHDLQQEKLWPGVRAVKEFRGVVTFGNPCANARQSVQWLEATGYNRCPLLHDLSMEELLEFYLEHFAIAIDMRNWATALLLFAIPYARKQVVIIGHENFIIAEEVKQQAKERRIRLETVPLTFFSSERIDKIRHQYVVRAGKGGLFISRQHEMLLGPQDKYLHMLPPMMQAQLGKNR